MPCRLVQRESFESEEVAALMNEGFVNIKVDREERPDVDKVTPKASLLLFKLPLCRLSACSGEAFPAMLHMLF